MTLRLGQNKRMRITQLWLKTGSWDNNSQGAGWHCVDRLVIALTVLRQKYQIGIQKRSGLCKKIKLTQCIQNWRNWTRKEILEATGYNFHLWIKTIYVFEDFTISRERRAGSWMKVISILRICSEIRSVKKAYDRLNKENVCKFALKKNTCLIVYLWVTLFK